MFKEKDDFVVVIQYELNDVKLKVFEVEFVVVRIVDLINELMIIIKEGDFDVLSLLLEKLIDDYKWEKKKFEIEFELIRESLREKETKFLVIFRKFIIKDEEVNMVFQRLEEKDKELKELREEI